MEVGLFVCLSYVHGKKKKKKEEEANQTKPNQNQSTIHMHGNGVWVDNSFFDGQGWIESSSIRFPLLGFLTLSHWHMASERTDVTQRPNTQIILYQFLQPKIKIK